MFKITAFTGMLVLMFSDQSVTGQKVRDSVKIDSISYKTEQLTEEKEQIIKAEKAKLKEAVKRIIDKEEKGEITAEEAQIQKEEAAREAALNIENKTAIVDNRIELVQRGEDYDFEYSKGKFVQLGFGNPYDESGSSLLGIHYKNKNKKVKPDKRTYSDVFFAFGLNNTITEGQSFDDSPYKIGGSRFFEIGDRKSTRLNSS